PEGDDLSSRVLLGAHGRYRRIEGAHVSTKNEPPFQSDVNEFLLCVSPDMTVDTLASLVARLVERGAPIEYGMMGMSNRRKEPPKRRFVVTTSQLPFEEGQ